LGRQRRDIAYDLIDGMVSVMAGISCIFRLYFNGNGKPVVLCLSGRFKGIWGVLRGVIGIVADVNRGLFRLVYIFIKTEIDYR
jgi:hypothetical protein